MNNSQRTTRLCWIILRSIAPDDHCGHWILVWPVRTARPIPLCLLQFFVNLCRSVTTFPVLTESMHLLMNRGYPQQGLSLWKTLQQLHQLGKFSTFSLTDEHLPRLQQLLEQYQSLPTDLADASLVLLAEHLGHGRIVSTDERDFQTYRWKQHHPFTNLLLP